jgi:hypothetical protein
MGFFAHRSKKRPFVVSHWISIILHETSRAKKTVLLTDLHALELQAASEAECGLYLTCKVNEPTMVFEPKLFPVKLPVI